MLKRLSLFALLLLPSGCASQTSSPPTATVTPTVAATPGLSQGARFSLVQHDSGPDRKFKVAKGLPAKATLSLHLQALRQPCVAVVTAFKRKEALPSRDFPPTVCALATDEPTVIDLSPKAGLPSTEIYVTILANDSPERKRIEQLVKQWRDDPKHSDPPRQALHDQLSEWFGRQDFAMSRSGPLPAQLGVVFPTAAEGGHPAASSQLALDEKSANKRNQPTLRKEPPPYDWLSQADWMVCSKELPGVFIYTVTMSAK